MEGYSVFYTAIYWVNYTSNSRKKILNHFFSSPVLNTAFSFVSRYTTYYANTWFFEPI